MRSVIDTAAWAAIRLVAVIGLLSCWPATGRAQSDLETVELGNGADGNLLLNIAVRKEARCNFGDLDAISLDMGVLGEEAGLQLTAEVLGGSSDQIFYGASGGDSYSLALPRFARPTVLGLFLCGASPSKPRTPCSRKRLQDYKQIFGPHTIDMSQAGSDGRNLGSVPARNVSPETVKNRIYFFRFAVIHGSKLQFPSRAMNDERYDGLITSLQQRNADVVDPASLRSTLQKYGSTLGSEPLLPAGNGIAFVLPHYDAVKCVGAK